MGEREMTSANTILIIDDEPNLRKSLALILQRADYAVTAAESAGKALQCLEAGAYDLVFLDLMMPEINGLDLLPDIRKKYPEMPVLILTAHATLESAIDAIRKGASDYLLKPLDPAQILQRVQEVLADQQQPRRRREIMSEIQGLLDELQGEDDSQTDQPRGTSLNVDRARILRRGPFTLDLYARSVVFGEKTLSLSPTAFDYLATLVRHSPNPVSYETLVIEAQGYKTSPVEAREMARWRIHELRKSIEADTRNPSYIITVRDVGYRLVT
jgi:DNA-binding response OmpR family regulator